MPLGKGPLSEIARVGCAGTSRIGKKRAKLIREKDRRLEEEKRERAWVETRERVVKYITQGAFIMDRARTVEVREALNTVYRMGRADLLSETLAGM